MRSPSLKRIAIPALIILALVVVIILFCKALAELRPQATPPMSAIFLTSDQVYFGRIVKETHTKLIVEHVYYLKASASAVNPDESSKAEAVAKLSLVKLGDELHRPKDRMTINKANVLFWEEMESQGVIIDAIHEEEQRSR